METLYLLSALVTVALIVASIFFLQKRKQDNKAEPVKEEEPPKKKSVPAQEPKKKVPLGKQKKQRLPDPDHPRHVTTLRHQQNTVNHVEFSPCGTFLATTAEDRTMLIYPIKEILNPAHPHRRVNIPGDLPGRFCFSADGKYIVVYTQLGKAVLVYSVAPKSVELVKELDCREYHKQLINSVDFASTMKYILTCSSTDTKINLWDIKGNHVTSLVTNQMSNMMAKFSPDGKFVAVASASTELRLWEIVEEKGGKFKALEKAMHGASSGAHKRAVHYLDFSSDSTKLATCSQDGTWKLWNVDVRYTRGEDARCLLTAKEPEGRAFQLIRVSPDGKKVATVSAQSTIILWNLESGEAYETIANAHALPITAISWSHNSKIIATSSEDRCVHLWKA